MDKDERIKLIAGRIRDEFRKHQNLDTWPEIAAAKLYHQWSEFSSHENKFLKDEVERLKDENDRLRVQVKTHSSLLAEVQIQRERYWNEKQDQAKTIREFHDFFHKHFSTTDLEEIEKQLEEKEKEVNALLEAYNKYNYFKTKSNGD